MDPLRKKISIYFALIIAVVILMVFLDYRFLLNRIKIVSNDVIAMRKRIHFIEGQVEYYDIIQNESSRVNQEREKIFKSYSKLSSSLEFFYFLEGIARKTNNSIEVDIKEGEKPLFSVKLTGTFNDLVKFFSILETMPLEIILNSVVKQGIPGSSPNTLIATFQVIPLITLTSKTPQ